MQIDFIVNGAERTGLLSTSTLEVEPGRFDGRVVALDDITDQIHLEQRFSEQERLAALGRLAAGLAHEVNTPVTGIASYAQLLHDLTPASDPRSPLVEKLEEQSFRVARIVTNLLELARPSGFERQLVNLVEVARDELVQIRGEAERLGVSLRLLAPDEVTARSNRVQLELVVHNLVRNALQATPAGGDVEIAAGKNGVGVWLEVRDTGPGVPAELRDQIFEPFVATRQGRGGTGLGLAITRDIVRAHGGNHRSCGRAMRDRAARRPARESRGSMRVLIVDDEPVLQDVLSTLLRREGFQVVQATTAAEALRQAEEQEVDLVPRPHAAGSAGP